MPVVQEVLTDMGLSLNLEKSRVVRAEPGFDFLGFRFIRRHSDWSFNLSPDPHLHFFSQSYSQHHVLYYPTKFKCMAI